MAGRPRLPRQTKIIKGTFHKYRNPESEPEFSSLREMPVPPKSLNKYGRQLWEKLLPELNRCGVITQADIPAFEMLCASFGRYKIFEEWLEKKPLANIETEKGGVSAQAKQMNAEFAMCQKMMQQFGLTPSDRNRIGLSKKKGVDPETQKMKELLGA